MNTRFIEKIRVVATISGAALVFAGERYFSSAPFHWALSGTGLLLLVLGVVFAALCFKGARSKGHDRELAGWKLAMCWQSQILAAFLIYFIYARLLGTAPAPDNLLKKALLALWLMLLVFGVFMGIGTEWAQSHNGRGEFAEPQRVRLASRGWLKVGMLAVIIAALNYVAVQRNVAWDLSYLKTTRASESTLKMIDGLSQDVEVALFFPQGNEVLSQARLYFDGLSKKNPKLLITYQDVEIQPLAAEKYKVSRNGYVVLKSGEESERFDVGLTIASARKTLKSLDSEFQKALLGVTEKRKVIYFTRGHGELTWTGGDEGSGLKSIKLLESYLRSLNFSMRFFGVSEGAANSVPSDADAVVVLGGDQPFLPEEERALQTYVENGGRLLVMLDVDMPTETSLNQGVRDSSKDPLVQWLSGIGITFEPKVLANTANFVAATRSDADVWFLFSNVFTSHESVQALARNEQRAAILTFRSGYLTTKQDVPGWSVFDTVRSLSDTFVDENRDFKFTEGKEKRAPRVIGAAAEKKDAAGADAKNQNKGRVIVFADASAVSDPMVRNQSNLIYFVDGLRWLVGDVKASGVASSEEDIRIRHTNKEDVAWFYGTVALVPGLVIIAGALATRRARRVRKEGYPS